MGVCIFICVARKVGRPGMHIWMTDILSFHEQEEEPWRRVQRREKDVTLAYLCPLQKFHYLCPVAFHTTECIIASNEWTFKIIGTCRK